MRSWIYGIGLAAMTLAITGCAENKLTRENFDLIVKEKSNKTEVEMTFGKPYRDLGDQWDYEDEDRHLLVTFHFDDSGVVTRKEWIDARTGEWSGADPVIDEDPEGRKMSDETGNVTIKKDG